jgi:hypothetical protein
MFNELPQHVREAYNQAVEEFRKYDLDGTLKPNTPEWEAAVKLAIAKLPIQAHADDFRNYLLETLPQRQPKCERNNDAARCKEGPKKFNTRCDLCGEIINKI